MVFRMRTIRSLSRSIEMVRPCERCHFVQTLRAFPQATFASVLRMINRRRRRFFNGQRAGKDEIRGERDSETDKPGVVVKRAKEGNDQSNPGRRATQKSRGDTDPSPAFIDSVFTIKIFDDQFASPKNPIVRNQHAGNRSQSTGVAEKPIEDVARWIREQFPGLESNPNEAREQTAAAEGDESWKRIGEIVCGRNDIGRDVH